ncbi:hypothetical protein AB0442_36415 [Kitasatospora sp. NPDC085895]|uniref:hypothetical protein n=1 Tax=Kitasatospora sp. NPDC085895 TaxID=3155057 RepID=UPI00344FD007
MDMGMAATVEDLAKEAERQIRGRIWELTPADRSVADKAATDLHGAIGPAPIQQALPPVDRLEHLREALATLAIALARVHGPMAWFLGAAVTALAPVLHWRALPTDDGPTFGAVKPTDQQYSDAENAVRRLQDILARLTSA